MLIPNQDTRISRDIIVILTFENDLVPVIFTFSHKAQTIFLTGIQTIAAGDTLLVVQNTVSIVSMDRVYFAGVAADFAASALALDADNRRSRDLADPAQNQTDRTGRPAKRAIDKQGADNKQSQQYPARVIYRHEVENDLEWIDLGEQIGFGNQ